MAAVFTDHRGARRGWRCRARRLAVAAALLGAALFSAYLLLRPRLERAIEGRLVLAARQRGWSLTIGSLQLGPWASLELGQLVIEEPARFRVLADSVVLRPRLASRGAAARLDLGRLRVDLPAGLRLEGRPSSWRIEPVSAGWRARWLDGRGRLEAELVRQRGTGAAADLILRAEGAALSEVGRLLYRGCPVAEPGRVSGRAILVQAPDGSLELDTEARTEGFALAAAALSTAPDCASAEYGAEMTAAFAVSARWDPRRGEFEARRWQVAAGSIETAGRLSVTDLADRPQIDLDLEVPRLAFAPLLAGAALDQRADDLGSLALALRVRGPLLEPEDLEVTHRLEFTPPSRPLPSIERLRGPFVHRTVPASGVAATIHVSPDSPDFVGLEQVPPLFLRALLIAEDSGFWGHPGIDLAELPVALATNLARGRLARGGSTIPQQLAKNLFLSRTKTLGRKLEEASLALLLDARLGKPRELEIYLNVIEWGPGVYGLRPAARHYFGVEPGQLTVKQSVFLVCLIPGPIKYQRSFPDGVPTPFLEGQMNALLVKLASVGALTAEEYAAALAAPLGLRLPPTEAAGAAAPATW